MTERVALFRALQQPRHQVSDGRHSVHTTRRRSQSSDGTSVARLFQKYNGLTLAANNNKNQVKPQPVKNNRRQSMALL